MGINITGLTLSWSSTMKNKRDWIIERANLEDKPKRLQDKLIEETLAGQLSQLAYYFYQIFWRPYVELIKS